MSNSLSMPWGTISWVLSDPVKPLDLGLNLVKPLVLVGEYKGILRYLWYSLSRTSLTYSRKESSVLDAFLNLIAPSGTIQLLKMSIFFVKFISLRYSSP